MDYNKIKDAVLKKATFIFEIEKVLDLDRYF